MALWLRIVLWLVVAIVPGGLVLLPLLVGDELRRRKALTAVRSRVTANS